VPFPQHPRKHLEEPLFTASEFHRYVAKRTGRPRPKPARRVILVFGGWRWKRYLSRRFHGRFEQQTGLYRARPSVGIYLVEGPGAPHVAIVAEELAALGVRRFVIVGIAGSLQPDVRVGSLILCTKALRDEGTSHHYVKPQPFARPSPALTARLKTAMERSGTTFEQGPTWTIDAPYRETVTEIRRYRKRGILTVEMEASALFSVARLRGCEAAALFVVSDNLDDRGWEPRFYDCRPDLYRALDIAIEALAA
jgi:uridine phosphorylase